MLKNELSLRSWVCNHFIAGDIAQWRHRWWSLARQERFGYISEYRHKDPESLLHEWSNIAVFLSSDTAGFLCNLDVLQWAWATLPDDHDREYASAGLLILAADLAVHADSLAVARDIERNCAWAYCWLFGRRSDSHHSCAGEIAWTVLTEAARLGPQVQRRREEARPSFSKEVFGESRPYWISLARVLRWYPVDTLGVSAVLEL